MLQTIHKSGCSEHSPPKEHVFVHSLKQPGKHEFTLPSIARCELRFSLHSLVSALQKGVSMSNKTGGQKAKRMHENLKLISGEAKALLLLGLLLVLK